MANVKISPIGLLDMLYFKGKKVKREKHIMETEAKPLAADYPTNIKAAERHPDTQEFIISEIIEENSDTRTYILRKKDGTNPAFFRAGQYLVVRQYIDGKLIARPVSLSSGPEDALNGFCSITVKRVPDGFMSKYILDNWSIGDTVTTSGPQGVFYYEGLRDAPKVIAAVGGSGITPVLSMAKAIASGDEDFDLTILYGSRSREDMLFAEVLEGITQRTPKVKLVNVFSDKAEEGAESGFITAELIKKYAGDGQFSVFAAGPQTMYRFLDGEVRKLGLSEKFYRKEIFGASKEPWTLPGYPAQAKDKTFQLTVKMCDKVYEIPCAANETVLVALERAGIAGPNRCRGGICGWCRSKLLAGDVFIPEDTDGRRAADKVYGYIHPCASYAVSDLTIEVPFNK